MGAGMRSAIDRGARRGVPWSGGPQVPGPRRRSV